MYALTVQPGEAEFDGQQYTAVAGKRRFSITQRQYRAFAASLAPLRPNRKDLVGDGSPRCGLYATDAPSVEVSWDKGDVLRIDGGCNADAVTRMERTIDAAEQLLPVRGLVDRSGQ